MSETGFTPGPWTFDAICFDRRIGIRGGVTAYGRPYTVAWVNRPGSAFDGQDKANALLIAASPSLYEALSLVRMSAGWHAMSDETKAVIVNALSAARGEDRGTGG